MKKEVFNMTLSCGCCPDENGGNAVRPILNDKFCGFFELDCNNQTNNNRFVWRSRQMGTPFPVAGTVTVKYEGGCANILTVNLRLNGDAGAVVGTLNIPEQPGGNPNSQSITVQRFDTLEIICAGTGANTCEGEYCLNIHYPSPFDLS
jgi:Protein of unknown function (DUF3992)